MRKIERADVQGFARYEPTRETRRRQVMAAKRPRRVQVGEIVTLVFENRETVLFQIEEMLRAERISAEDKIAEEIAVYNDLIPGPDELSATMFIEIDDARWLRRELPQLVGIERAVELRFDGAGSARAIPEEGRSTEEKTSTVHYLRFPLRPEQSQALRQAGARVELAVDHPHLQAATVLSEESRASLAGDLEAE